MPPKPKKKCCVSKPRCGRCPLRLLAEGRLPEGYTVKKRKLVKTEVLASTMPPVIAATGNAKKAKKAKKGKKKKLAVAA
ncbi:MAG: hypothetical protein WBQ50_01985 [Nocardioides sp.]